MTRHWTGQLHFLLWRSTAPTFPYFYLHFDGNLKASPLRRGTLEASTTTVQPLWRTPSGDGGGDPSSKNGRISLATRDVSANLRWLGYGFGHLRCGTCFLGNVLIVVIVISHIPKHQPMETSLCTMNFHGSKSWQGGSHRITVNCGRFIQPIHEISNYLDPFQTSCCAGHMPFVAGQVPLLARKTHILRFTNVKRNSSGTRIEIQNDPSSLSYQLCYFLYITQQRRSWGYYLFTNLNQTNSLCD